MSKTDVMLVSESADGALHVAAPNELAVTLLEDIAAAVLVAVLRRGANLLNILYKLKTKEVVETKDTRPPIVIT